MAEYTVRRSSFQAAFPNTLPVPALLSAFAEFLEQVPHGGLGYFDALMAEPLAEAFPDPRRTPMVSARLGLFLKLPDGSRLALWDHGGKEPSIVKLGSEGELENVAPSLAAFLVGLSRGTTGVNELDEDEGSHRERLAQWLKGRVEVDQVRLDCAEVPYFDEWYEALLEGRQVPSAIWPTNAGAQQRATFEMANFSGTVTSLLGRALRDADVLTFLRALGPLPRKTFLSRVDFDDRARGFSLSADDVGNAKTLLGCFFYSEGWEDHRAFAHPLPKGIAWNDTAATLAARLGPPTHEIKSKKSGQLVSQQWGERSHTLPYVAVGYRGNGAQITTVFVGLLSS